MMKKQIIFNIGWSNYIIYPIKLPLLPQKLTCPLKNSGWQMKIPLIVYLKWPLFSGHVSFRGGVNPIEVPLKDLLFLHFIPRFTGGFSETGFPRHLFISQPVVQIYIAPRRICGDAMRWHQHLSKHVRRQWTWSIAGPSHGSLPVLKGPPKW